MLLPSERPGKSFLPLKWDKISPIISVLENLSSSFHCPFTLTEIFWVWLTLLGKNRLIVWSVLQSDFNLTRFKENAGRGQVPEEEAGEGWGLPLEKASSEPRRVSSEQHTMNVYKWINASKLGKPQWLSPGSLPNRKCDWENVPSHSLLGLHHFPLTLHPSFAPGNCKTPTLLRRVRKISKVGTSKMHFGLLRAACDWHSLFTRNGSRP